MKLQMWRETVKMAGFALMANRLRSLLALLGVVIGVGTVIGMVSLINGLQKSFQESIQSLGSNTIYIRRIRPGFQINGTIPDSLKQRRAFTMADAAAITQQCPAVLAVSPWKFPYDDMRLAYREKKTRITFVYGTDERHLLTHGYELAQGRFFTAEEVERRANLVVIGKDTREALFANANPIGRVIHIKDIPFTVIGEFTTKGKLLGHDFDEVAVVPYTVIDKYFAAPFDAPPWFPKRGELFLDAIATSPAQSEEAQRQISEVLRIRRHLPSNRPNNFVVFTDDAFLTFFNTITLLVSVVMLPIALISLVVGCIGIMNIMLVSVTERTREIGVRKALGAPRGAILNQFLVEAMMLTAIGGVFGLLLGAGFSWAGRMAFHLPAFIPVPWAIGAVLASAAVGVFFGLYPAMRASRLDPVDSLRYE